MPLTIPQRLYDELRAHGEHTYPHECCGILLGKCVADILSVTAILRAANTRIDSPHNRYHIAPEELIAAQRHARASGLEIIGFYHSHPDHPAHWSPTDLAEAHWLGCAYAITTVACGRATLTNSFLLIGTTEDDKTFAPLPIAIESV